MAHSPSVRHLQIFWDLLVREGVDGIFSCGFKCRINPAQDSADQGNDGGVNDPGPSHLDAKSRKFRQDAEARRNAIRIPQAMPAIARTIVSPTITFTM